MNKSAAALKVLVVDDSPVYRKLVEHALSKEPYTLLFAKSGQEAMELYAQHSPLIVITDWMMPDYSGLELCKRIRGNGKPAYTYIIVLTGMTEKDHVTQGLAAGANDYLTKPFDPAELLARIGVGRHMVEMHSEIDAKKRKLEELAQSDALTGLPNRRAAETWAERQLRGAARHDFWCWAVVGDLDCFKDINGRHGHESGDAVLKGFAEVLKRNTRASDFCGRMGEDEFLLVITHVEPPNIRLAVERMREQFASQRFKLGGQSVAATASFGIAGCHGRDAPGFHELVRQADKALYAAKHAGRNQVKLATE